ncbi:MAG: hypothetical protein ACK5JH_06245 [Anaerocolumna sp.]
MKKGLVLLLSLVLVVSMFAACGKKDDTTETPTEAVTPEATEAVTPEATEAPATTDAVKTGLGVVSSIAKSKDASTEDGVAQVDSYVAAVLVGADGKIVDCAFDAAQTKINFSAEGKLTTDLATEFKTKQELGTEYGMLSASSIGKEWNEQADAFAAYVIGKTIDEVKGIAVTEEGVATDADLAATVTVKLGTFISALEKAVATAQDLGATSADKLGLGVATNIAKSKDAGEEAGVAQAYSNYAAVTTDGSGKITSCAIDASQSNVNFDATGVVTSDLAGELKTKQELGADYGMVANSSIGKEWFEQANALAAYVAGKTIDEVKGIALTEEGTPADADLASSVTVHIGDYTNVIDKAVANAAK